MRPQVIHDVLYDINVADLQHSFVKEEGRPGVKNLCNPRSSFVSSIKASQMVCSAVVNLGGWLIGFSGMTSILESRRDIGRLSVMAALLPEDGSCIGGDEGPWNESVFQKERSLDFHELPRVDRKTDWICSRMLEEYLFASLRPRLERVR